MASAPPRLELVSLSPTADSRLRWADGCLKGVKVFRWDWDVRINWEKRWAPCSPHHRAFWFDGKLSAENFYSGDTVRGEGGIHAIWPPQLDLDKECAALEEFVGYAPRGRGSDFTCLVKGWGRSVMGDVGWRAEHAAIVTVISPPAKNARALRQWCREHNIGWSVL